MSYRVGEILDGVVVGVTRIGAFVRLEDGTEGLVHISEISDEYVEKVEDKVTKGEEVKVKVISINPDGKIALIDEGAFAYAEKDNIEKPLMYNEDSKAGNGAGSEDFGTKKLFILHPLGFTFVGVLGTDYASKSGLTLAELQGGGLYELAVDVKLSPITILWIAL